jgi:hypothetical protein
MKKTILLFLMLAGISLAACLPAVPATSTPTPDPFIVQGKNVFNARCATCHALVPETIIIGPSLAHIATVAETRVPGQSAEEYIQLSVMRPGDYVVEGYNNIMVTNLAKELTSEELNALVAFLLTLK